MNVLLFVCVFARNFHFFATYQLYAESSGCQIYHRTFPYAAYIREFSAMKNRDGKFRLDFRYTPSSIILSLLIQKQNLLYRRKVYNRKYTVYTINSMENITFEWNNDKNIKLRSDRGVSFETIIAAIDDGWLVDIVDHPNQEQYAHQNILCVRWNGYIYLVPFVRNWNVLFLKTIIPSRKATKKYIS